MTTLVTIDIEMHEDQPLPPATFEFLVISMKTQIELHLGLFNPGDAENLPKPDLRVARHLIDTLSMLQTKTKGNLVWEEERLLNNVLTELRFRFTQVFEESKKKTQAEDSGTQAAQA